MWIGVDDTDSPAGGCTTYVLSELLRLARAHGLDPIGYPRLVRLNPNIPWKTRGNAALAVRLGLGRGSPPALGGTIDDAELRVFVRGAEPTEELRERYASAAWAAVRALAPEVPGTDPALVVTTVRPPPAFYWRAVREVVPVEDALDALGRIGARSFVRGSARGLVGATAAVAWPGRRSTWEWIAYREPERVGTRRSVDAASVRAAAQREPSLFLCDDARTRRLLVAPHTDCPILFGLRSTDPAAARRAAKSIRSEPVARAVLYRTNQGTGDHLRARRAGDIEPFGAGIVGGTVATAPRARRGGHVAFELEDALGSVLACVAFEPTKTLPRAAQQLRVGDRVRVWGSRGAGAAFHLEGLALLRAGGSSPRLPPTCPECRRSTRSLGRIRGYRCPRCRRSFPPEAARRFPRRWEAGRGRIDPTPSARRHLHPVRR